MAKTTYKIQVEFLNGTTGEYGNKEGCSVIKEPASSKHLMKAVGCIIIR